MPYDEALEDVAGTLTTPPEAVVGTTAGPVQGVLRSSIYTFKGIPYGADTGGEARFRAPKPPVPWTDVRPALAYGPCCPQVDRAGWASGEHAFLFDWDDGFAGQD